MTGTEWGLLISWLFAANLVSFFAMGVDKSRARKGEWRIPELALLTSAFLGGAFGVVAGSQMFHHKTSKASFIVVAYVAALLCLLVLYELQRILGSPFA